MAISRRWRKYLDEAYRFEANELVILSAVPEDDMQAARWLREDVADLRNAGVAALVCTYHAGLTGQAFMDQLGALAERAQAGVIPMLHFDGHGLQDRMQFSDGSEVPWRDITQQLRAINVATRNHLVVSSGSCFGAWLYDKTDLDAPAPVFGLVATMRTVPAGDVDRGFRIFYRELFRTFEFARAYNQMMEGVENKVFGHVFAPDFLETVVRGYIVDFCMGEGRRFRAEALVTKAVERGMPLAQARKMVREGLRKPQAPALERMGKHFLMIDRYPENQERFPVNYVWLEQAIRAEALERRGL